MPFATGTANTPGELLVAVDTLVTANGWTRLRGEPDQNCLMPKAARYWRLLWLGNEDDNNDYRELTTAEFRTTVGGAAIAGTWTSKGINTGSLPGLFRTAGINDDVWWMTLDCGSPTIVREMMIQCQTDNEAPSWFFIQWSNDNRTWCNMFEQRGLAWVDNETKTFALPADGTTFADHVSGTQCRRLGNSTFEVLGSVSVNDSYRSLNNDIWTWQAPGYDANRRVFIQARGHANITDSSGYIAFITSPTFDPSIESMTGQLGGAPDDAVLIFDGVNPVEYWIYMNGHRLIVILKSGVDNYTSAYLGFLAAFADPDNYPFPLFQSATSYQFDAENVTNNRLSSMCDPGDNAGKVRLWDNTWNDVENRNSSSATNLYKEFPPMWTWPYHVGGTARGNWPFVWVGDYVDFDNHWLNQHIPTEQGDLPLYPVTVQDNVYGNIGVLDGVFCIPGGTLVEEQVFVINAVNYRAFPNRDRRAGCNWFVVRED